MSVVELSWLFDESTKKKALQEVFACSGQLLKRHFSNKELDRPVRAKDVSKLPIDFVNHQKINPSFVGPMPSILKETKDFLVLHKPPEVHCHPLCYSDQDTLLNYLLQEKKWETLAVNKDNYDRGLIFRLDFETSGVMLVAKTEEFFRTLRNDFKQNMKQKLYWAIVEGDFDQDGEWTHYFRATGIKGAKQKVSEDSHPDSTVATLGVRRLATAHNKSLVLVNLQTGLRHQIRAQLAYLGFPLLGDELYGGRKGDRLFLHAFHYEWTDFIQDPNAELFDRFFDLNSALQMSNDVLRHLKSR